MPGIGSDLRVEQFKGGQSNPTFRLSSGGRHYVLRRKPPGTLLPSAHAVDREFRLMRALQGSPVPVPRMHALCDRFVDTLVDLHALDYQAIGLSDVGRPEGYVERQVSGWSLAVGGATGRVGTKSYQLRSRDRYPLREFGSRKAFMSSAMLA